MEEPWSVHRIVLEVRKGVKTSQCIQTTVEYVQRIHVHDTSTVVRGAWFLGLNCDLHALTQPRVQGVLLPALGTFYPPSQKAGYRPTQPVNGSPCFQLQDKVFGAVSQEAARAARELLSS